MVYLIWHGIHRDLKRKAWKDSQISQWLLHTTTANTDTAGFRLMGVVVNIKEHNKEFHIYINADYFYKPPSLLHNIYKNCFLTCVFKVAKNRQT